MPAGVDVVDGIVQTIGVQVDAADRLGFEIADKILVQESTGFRVVVAAVQVVKPDGSIVVIPAVAEGIGDQNAVRRLLQQIAPTAAALDYIIRRTRPVVNTQKHSKRSME